MWSLRILIGMCTVAGLRCLGIAYVTLLDIDRYRALHTAGYPALRIGINLGFGLLLLGVGWRVWRYKRRLDPIVLWVWGGYLLFNFLWLAGYAQTTFDRNRLAFVGVTSILVMGLTIGLQLRLRNNFGV